jgi:hypothetical protein
MSISAHSLVGNLSEKEIAELLGALSHRLFIIGCDNKTLYIPLHKVGDALKSAQETIINAIMSDLPPLNKEEEDMLSYTSWITALKTYRDRTKLDLVVCKGVIDRARAKIGVF